MTDTFVHDAVDASDPARSQTDVVMHGIKTMITDGRLVAGSRLPIEKDLAAQLGISRGSLREGVRALCAMGVLETRQGDGTYVTSLDASLLLAPMGFMVDLHTPAASEHVQSVRRVLETEAAGRAALLIEPEALEEARAALQAIEPMIAGEAEVDYDALMVADVAFHRTIARASGNPALAALIEALASRTVRGRMSHALSRPGIPQAAHSEHRAVLAALEKRDPDRARLAMGIHLMRVEDYLHDHPLETEDQ
jgi:DNA-binding FadR family transcriptional regulator